MAHPPATNTKSSAPDRADPFREAIANALMDGYSQKQILDKLAGRDQKKRKAVRQRIRYMARNDPKFGGTMASVVKGEALLGLPSATAALIRRAARGRTDSIKLLYELTGLHNPRTTHEHTGEISIKLEGMHRPPRTVDELGPPVVEAEVVED